MINVVCYGNSITAGIATAGWDTGLYGLGQTGGASTYPTQLKTILGIGYTITNAGHGGLSTRQLRLMFSSYATPYFDAGATRNILIVAETINHVALEGATYAQAVQEWIDLLAVAQAAGWEVYVGTGTMRSSQQINYGYFPDGDWTTIDAMQDKILAVNAWMRANWATHADGFVDFARAVWNGNPLHFETKFTTDPGPAPWSDSAHLDGSGYLSLAQRAAFDVFGIPLPVLNPFRDPAGNPVILRYPNGTPITINI